jgi:hypothetical protein
MSQTIITDTDSMVAAYLARHGATKVALGETALSERLDIRNRPEDTRRTMVGARSESEYLWEMGFQAEAQARARGE